MGHGSREVKVTLASTPGHVKQKNCSRCGAAFHCGAESGGTRCWCDDASRVTPDTELDCFCPACLGDVIAQRRYQPRQPLVEGEDYRAEGKVIVFTARYLRRRGYCCGRACRHCPYR
jgi:hypothetical protein